MTSPWMAPQKSADCKIESFKRPMFPEGFQCILRAGRCESARWRFERRYADLIESYQEHEWKNRDLFEDVDKFSHLIFSII